MRFAFTFPLLVALFQCSGDETLSGYGASDATWKLVEIDGQVFPADATIKFPEEGKITGEGPCNQFFGSQLEPYPWFKTENLASTRRACPDLEAETWMLQSLDKMTLAEVSANALILNNDAGGEMVFEAVR